MLRKLVNTDNKQTQHTTPARVVSYAGDILTVTLSQGLKVLADFYDSSAIVELSHYRRVELVDLPNDIQNKFGVDHYAHATYVALPLGEGYSDGFTFDGSSRRAVYLYDLPVGQLVNVLPDIFHLGACVPVPRPQPTLNACCALVAAV